MMHRWRAWMAEAGLFKGNKRLLDANRSQALLPWIPGRRVRVQSQSREDILSYLRFCREEFGLRPRPCDSAADARWSNSGSKNLRQGCHRNPSRKYPGAREVLVPG